MKITARLLALAALVAAPLPGQQPMGPDSAHHPGAPMMGRAQGMMEPGMAGMMGMMMPDLAYDPAHLLAMNGELSLTAQQITALTALRDAAKRARDAAMDKAKGHLDELRTALDAPAPDTTAIRTHFLAAHDAMGQAHLAMLIANARAKALLTDAQRAQVQQMHRGMMEGRRRGGPGRPDGWHGRPALRVF